MLIKLEAIQQKYALTTEELVQAINKLFKKRLQVPKKMNKNTMLMEDLRLYALANDSKDTLQNYYKYEIGEVEKKYLERYDNKTNSKILDLSETKKLMLIILKEKEEGLEAMESEQLKLYYEKETKNEFRPL